MDVDGGFQRAADETETGLPIFVDDNFIVSYMYNYYALKITLISSNKMQCRQCVQTS